MTEYGAELLRRQLAEFNKNPIDLVSVGLKDDSNIYEWELLIMGPGKNMSVNLSYLMMEVAASNY